MKKLLLIVVVIGMCLASALLCCTASTFINFNTKSIKGSGNLITKTLDAPTFDRVKASCGIKVVITDKATDKITIEADDNLIEYVIVQSEEGKLKVTLDPRKQGAFSNTHITVTIPTNTNIRALNASSAAVIQSDVALSADVFELDASSAAKISATIKARKCDAEVSSAAQIEADITATECELSASSAAMINATIKTTKCSVDGSSAAKIDLKGSAESCEIDFSSAAKFRGEEFVVNDYDVEVSSGSSATIHCNGQLKTRATSGASVRYTGEPKNYQNHNSSGGRVSRL